MLNDFDTADLLSNRRDDVTPEDERTVSDLMVDQIEFADIIVLNKIDMVAKETRGEILQLVKKLNHRAKVIETNYGKVDVKELVNTGLFKLDVAQSGYGWLQDLHAMTVREVNGRNVVTPKPETEEYNVQSFIYSRYRPFHPSRLYKLFYDKFILQLEHGDDNDDDDDGDEDDVMEGVEGDAQMEDLHPTHSTSADSESNSEGHSASSPRSSGSTAHTVPSPRPDEDKDINMELDDLVAPDNTTILANKRDHPTFRRLFRSKGEFYLATRPHRAGDWSQAGAILTMTGGRPWFCTLPAEEYTTGDAEVDALVQHDISKGGEWGDRRQELVFIGEKLDHESVEALLDTCLLTDAEFEDWKKIMRNGVWTDEKKREELEELFDDGFPDWPEDDDDHEGHDHPHPKELRSITKELQEVS